MRQEGERENRTHEEHHHHHHHHHHRSGIPVKFRLPLIILAVLLVVGVAVVILVTELTSKKTDSVDAPPVAHTHSYGEWIAEVPATCTTDGKVGHYHCACGLNFDSSYQAINSLIIPRSHSYGEWIAEVAPTCTQNGVMGHYQCTACGKVFDAEHIELSSLELPAAHKTQWVEEVPATGNVPGTLGHFHCAVCGKDFDDDENELTDLTIPATGKYLVRVVGNHPGGVIVSDGEAERILSKGSSTSFTVDAGYGYTFDHFEINGAAQAGNTVTLENVTDDVAVFVVCDYATYELPIINIDTNGAEILDKENYVPMSFSLDNCEKGLADCAGGIRLRGNSTMSFDKKPYRIKFDKKQSLFGLKKAKSWVLLAEYLDPSALHNYTAFTLRQEIDGETFTPTPHKVNVYLNGEYQGLYTLCEQVQENEGRVDNEKAITEEMTQLKDYNFLIVMDGASEVYVTVENCVEDDEKDPNRYFQIKYPEEPDFKSPEQYEAFLNDLQTYLTDLVNAFKTGNVEYVLQEVDINSLLDFMIVDQVMGERDHATKSVYLYFKDGKLNFGPIWDYDWCLYTNFGDLQYFEVSEEFEYSNVFFQSVHDTPELYQLLKERYIAVGSAALARTIEKITAVEATIQESVQLDAEKWYPSSDNQFKPYSGYGLSQKQTEFLNAFLAKRKALLDAEWKIAE